MKHMISVFNELAKRVSEGLSNKKIDKIIEEAITQNSWFNKESIEYAIDAIVCNYLQVEKIEAWVTTYKIEKAKNPKNVAVIMAGNIPLVGLFDIMSVIFSGNRCLYKTSSKDRVLIEYIIGTLKEIDPEILIEKLDDKSHIDALIATGGDNTVRIFKDRYGDIPAIYRGSRFSMAVLNGEESEEELKSLADDIFRHAGLGCRNVSMIATPQNYNLNTLCNALKCYGKYNTINKKYVNNYTQNRAMMKLDQLEFFDGDFFTLTHDDQPSYIISNINISKYKNTEDIKKWILNSEDKIQCVVSNIKSMPFRIKIGQAQKPTLNDYPDRVDTTLFLMSI